MSDMLSSLERLTRPRILAVGDLILDRYTWGNAERISPEAPVMVLSVDREEVRLGGAASVASLLRALEAEVTLVGIVGDDGPGRVMRKLLADEGIHHEAVLTDGGRQTTSKERFMGRAATRHPQQILRVDREDCASVNADIEQSLLQAFLELLDSHALVLVADYAKGVCTPSLVSQVIQRATAKAIPVFIDPGRIPDYSKYRGASLLVPNRAEAAMASGRKIETSEDALAAAEFLSERGEIPAVLVKLESDGMVLVQAGKEGRHFPTSPRAVYDVTGAGDMVLAVVGLARASGLDWDETIKLANLAAGLEVEKLGVASVTRPELRKALARTHRATPDKLVSLPEMAILAESYRSQGKTIVFTNGCFDLLHVGHVAYLREAAEWGDVLVVAINSDDSVRRLKGPVRPVILQADRAEMLAALGCVAHVLIFNEDTPHELLLRLRPDVLVKGGTYSREEVAGHEIVTGCGGEVAVLQLVAGVSTTKIIDTFMAKNHLPSYPPT